MTRASRSRAAIRAANLIKAICRTLLAALASLYSLHCWASQPAWFTAYEDAKKAERLGEWSECVKKLGDAIREKPVSDKSVLVGVRRTEYLPYYYRGMCYFRLRQWDNARVDFQTATNEHVLNDPSFAAFSNMVHLSLAQIAEIHGAGNSLDEARNVLGDDRTTKEQQDDVHKAMQRVTEEIDQSMPGTRNDRLALAVGTLKTLLADVRTSASRPATESVPAATTIVQTPGQDKMGPSPPQKPVGKTVASKGEPTHPAQKPTPTVLASPGFSKANPNDTAVSIHPSEPAHEVPQTNSKPIPKMAVANARVKAEQSEALAAATRLASAGRYVEAADKLCAALTENPDKARFETLAGVYYYTSFLLSRSQDRALEIKAREVFTRALAEEPNLTLSDRFFSPRVTEFFARLKSRSSP